jgi:hypothetical protein
MGKAVFLIKEKAIAQWVVPILRDRTGKLGGFWLLRNLSRNSCAIAQAVERAGSQLGRYRRPTLYGNQIGREVGPFWPQGDHSPDSSLIGPIGALRQSPTPPAAAGP